MYRRWRGGARKMLADGKWTAATKRRSKKRGDDDRLGGLVFRASLIHWRQIRIEKREKRIPRSLHAAARAPLTTPPLDLNHKSRRRHYYQETAGSKALYFESFYPCCNSSRGSSGLSSENFGFLFIIFSHCYTYTVQFGISFVVNFQFLKFCISCFPLEQDIFYICNYILVWNF